MLKKLMTALMALTLAFGTYTATANQAEAGSRGARVAAGVAAGIIGLGVLGAYAHARDRHYYRSGGGCYPGPERCGYTSRRCFYNQWGDYICRGGSYRCWRDTICD